MCVFNYSEFSDVIRILVLDVRLFAVLSRNPEAERWLRASFFFFKQPFPTLELLGGLIY